MMSQNVQGVQLAIFLHFEVTADGGIEHMVHIKLAKVRSAIPPPHT